MREPEVLRKGILLGKGEIRILVMSNIKCKMFELILVNVD